MNRPRIAIPEPSALHQEYSRSHWPLYASAIHSAGGEPVFIPLSDPPARIANIIATCQGAVLPGSGADVNPSKYCEHPNGSSSSDPARETADELVLQDAFNLHKPILGICYGFQSMNVWLGGSLIQDLPSQNPSSVPHGRVNDELPPLHPVNLAANSRLRALAQAPQAPVNSSHHQSVSRLGDGLQLAATCTEDGVIEAAEIRGASFAIGVQWHPEISFQDDPFSRRIFTALVDAARIWQPIPNTVSHS